MLNPPGGHHASALPAYRCGSHLVGAGVFELSDKEAFDLFRELRWGKGEEVVCPDCGVVERHWFVSSRRQWRCKGCGHTFSVTSGTIFAHHKLPLRVYLGAVAIYTNAAKGLSALQMSRDLGVQYKSAFVLMHKLRESLIEQRAETPLSGEVDVDAAYVGGYVLAKKPLCFWGKNAALSLTQLVNRPNIRGKCA